MTPNKPELPYWPGAMKRATAARYLELSVAKFEQEVAAGRLPLPIILGNAEHWTRAKIDEALERLHGGGDDWRARLGFPE